MQEITGINHVGLRVRDLDIAREFYERLGFEFLAGPMGSEPVAIMEHPSGVNINFIINASDDAPQHNVLMQKEIKYPGYTHIALEVNDVESVTQKIKALAITITGKVEHEGAKFIFIRDPDDNVIEFHQPASS